MGPNYCVLREPLLTSPGKSFGSMFISGDYLMDSVFPTRQGVPGEDSSFAEPDTGPGTQEALNNQLLEVTPMNK